MYSRYAKQFVSKIFMVYFFKYMFNNRNLACSQNVLSELFCFAILV